MSPPVPCPNCGALPRVGYEGYCSYCLTAFRPPDTAFGAAPVLSRSDLAERLAALHESGPAGDGLHAPRIPMGPLFVGYIWSLFVALTTLGTLAEVSVSLGNGDLVRAVGLFIFAGGFGYFAWRTLRWTRRLHRAPITREIAGVVSITASTGGSVPQSSVALQLMDGSHVKRLVSWYCGVQPMAVGDVGVADMTEKELMFFRAGSLLS